MISFSAFTTYILIFADEPSYQPQNLLSYSIPPPYFIYPVDFYFVQQKMSRESVKDLIHRQGKLHPCNDAGCFHDMNMLIVAIGFFNLNDSKVTARLNPDEEIGAAEKFISRGSTQFLCRGCLAARLDVPPEMIDAKIEQFKLQGCTLFV